MNGDAKMRFSFIWMSFACVGIMAILLILGERTLPLFGDDRELAARVYKSVFMLLGVGIVAGVIHSGAHYLAGFLRAQVEGISGQEGFFASWGMFVTRHNIPGMFEGIAPWLAGIIGASGVALAIVIWFTE